MQHRLTAANKAAAAGWAAALAKEDRERGIVGLEQ
jgi:hypothetical protein